MSRISQFQMMFLLKSPDTILSSYNIRIKWIKMEGIKHTSLSKDLGADAYNVFNIKRRLTTDSGPCSDRPDFPAAS